MKKILKNLLEMPTVLHRTLLYINLIQKREQLFSSIQTPLWQKVVTAYKPNLVFPLFFDFDDYRTNNSLGSHASQGGKIGALYMTLPCLPLNFKRN